MRLRVLGSLGALASTAQALWSTLYSTDGSSIYIYLQDGTLLNYNSSSTTGSSLSKTDILSGLNLLASPSTNASLALDSKLGLWSVSPSGSCGASPIVVDKYDSSNNEWAQVATSNKNWATYNSSVWLANDGSDDIIYIYGGICGSQISDDLYAFNTSNHEFFEPSVGTSPAALYDTSVVQLSNTSSLLIGGKSTDGWIGMNQLALWETDSWTFKSVSNYSGIDSRTNSLVLPVDTNTVLVLGGDVSGRLSNPQVAAISISKDSSFSWTAPSESLGIVSDVSTISGAFSLFGSLITIGSFSDDQASDLQLYDSQSLQSVSSVAVVSSAKSSSKVASSSATGTPTSAAASSVSATSSASSSSSSTSSTPISKGGIAAISTIVPLGIFGGVAAIAVFFIRRKKRQQIIPYQKGLSPASSFQGFGQYFVDPNPNPWYSAADGDNNSINSWNQKRAQYDQQHNSRLSMESIDVPLPVHAPGTQLEPEMEQRPFSPESRRSSFYPDSVVAPTSPRTLSHYQNGSGGLDNLEENYDERDVQVLVSSRRRTRLVIANPDIDSVDPDQSASNLSRSSSNYSSTRDTAVHRRSRSDISSTGASAPANGRVRIASGSLLRRQPDT